MRDLVDLGSSKLDERTNTLLVQAKSAPIGTNDDEAPSFGDTPVFGVGCITARPWPKDERGTAQGIVDEGLPGMNGAVTSWRDTRYLNAYARAKAAQERLVLARRPDALVLRPRAVWGPGDPTLLPRLLARVRGGRLLLPAGGALPASMTYVDSLVEAVVAGLRTEVSGPVNVADATPLAPSVLLTRLFGALGRPVRIVGIPVVVADAAALVVEALWGAAGRRAEPPVTRYAVAAFGRPLVLDLSRLHDELGIALDADVADGVARVVAALSVAGHEDGGDDRSSPP